MASPEKDTWNSNEFNSSSNAPYRSRDLMYGSRASQRTEIKKTKSSYFEYVSKFVMLSITCVRKRFHIN